MEAESVGIGRRAVARFAEVNGWDALKLGRVRLSISEALSNVVLHAHDPGQREQAHLGLVAECDHTALVVSVSDEGSGLRLRTDSPGMGLGLGLIASSSDELAIETGPEGGTIVRMTFLC